MPQWVAGSTRRIAQMTGDYDPEGLTHAVADLRKRAEAAQGASED